MRERDRAPLDWPARMNQTERYYRIDQLVRERGPISREDLMAALAHELVDTIVALGLVHSRAILAAPGPVASRPRPCDDPATLLAGRATTGAGVVAISWRLP